MKLPLSYFHNDDVVFLAKDLLGKILFTNIDNQITAGIITETEAYCQSEKGCHAYNGKRTRRTENMFQQGGYAYIYL
ncbi:MAG TPA: DNA-3-methyladenine glycosylase, partial [Chitinophagales bacterium]|nr:DNA-3-methyladenine glycosylase [Chitinophagales bacterium]